jgi:UDP-galactose transporter B1
MSHLNNTSNESSVPIVTHHDKQQRHLHNPETTNTTDTNQNRRVESFSSLTAITVPLDDSSLSEEEEFLSAETNPVRVHKKVVFQRVSSSVFPLTFGVLGVWISYICYGTLQEDLFTKSAFHHAWFLQVLESSVHCLLGFLLRQYTQHKPADEDGKYLVRYNVRNMMPFFQSGCSQVFAKAFVSMSLANGLSFAVCTLAKSAKLIPVLACGILLGGATLSLRDCVFALFIVSGTAVLSMTKSSHGKLESSNHSTPIGLLLILASLTMDGVTAGLQKRLKKSTASQPPGVPEFLFFCSASMAVTAFFIALCTGELREGIALLQMDTTIRRMVAVACLCSAVGQCFVFYIITRFDPVTLAMVTTSRKLLSVIYSLSRQSNNNTLSGLGRFGLILAIIGILGDVQSKIVHAQNTSCKRQSQNKFSAAV